MSTSSVADRVIVSLDAPAARDPEVAGHKAATLARLKSEGFAVPRGIVLTRAGCERILAASGLGPGALPEAVAAAVIPAEVQRDLSASLEGFDGAALAVRSSGLAEDLPGASFAGQYETVLGVRGADALADAVLRCLGSAFSARVAAYAHRMDGRAPMAVLIQEMVQADVAGVAFTANPVTGDPETLVSAVRGLGDRLVGGEATSDEWVVRDGRAERGSGSEDAIDADAARRIADLAARVEATLGAPQDIEWAIAGDELFLLQARPITALPRKPEIDPPTVGYWMKDDGHYPMPLTPFGASVYIPAIVAGVTPMCDDFGVLFEGIDQRSLGGEVYMRPIPIGGKESKAPPWWVLWLAARLAPPLRRRARIADEAIRSGLADRLVDRWYGEWRDAFRQGGAALRARNLRALSDDELLGHLEEAIDLLGRGQTVHFSLFGPYVLGTYELGVACQELLGWSPLEALTLLTGTSEASSAPGRALAGLAESIAVRPEAREVVERDAGALLTRMRAVAPDIAAAIEGYLDDHGHRTLSYDPGDPTLAERPELLAGLLRDRLGRSPAGAGTIPGETGRAEALARARAALVQRTAGERDRFEQALAAAERVYPTREDNIALVDNVPAGLLRYAMVEFGRRLAERGVIAGVEDAAFLEVEELRGALQGGASDLRSVVARRRAERAWVVAHPGPASYGEDPGPPPDLRGLPPALRHVMSALMWMMGIMIKPAPVELADGQVAGIAGSPGRHTGPVRIIRDETEFGRLRLGDVLVCPITTPSWSVLFSQAGALVTDGGGVLAHAAIIAREYGIPAVVATKDATRRLTDGQLVTVDGSAGVVSLA
jgi:phosphohistidine swiveling domain-containing protein